MPTTAKPATARLAELNRRLVEIPHELDALAAQRDNAMRGGPAGVVAVRRIDERVSELRTEAQVLEASRPSLSREASMERERRSRRQEADVDVRRADLLEAARADVEAVLHQLGRIERTLAGGDLQPEQIPGVLQRMANLGAALRQEWANELDDAERRATHARALLNALGRSA